MLLGLLSGRVNSTRDGIQQLFFLADSDHSEEISNQELSELIQAMIAILDRTTGKGLMLMFTFPTDLNATLPESYLKSPEHQREKLEEYYLLNPEWRGLSLPECIQEYAKMVSGDVLERVARKNGQALHPDEFEKWLRSDGPVAQGISRSLQIFQFDKSMTECPISIQS